jgi:hypothetical protein
MFEFFINYIAGLAQSVERGTFNPEVKGSSPLFGDSFFSSPFFHIIGVSGN